MTRIGDILTRHKTPVSVQDDVTYKQVTIRTNYKGVVLRGHKPGIEIGTKNQWAVTPNQFILSRIDARQGAFGIVPEELDLAIVTNDFLAYDLNEKKVDRNFFNIFLQSPVFLNACINASRGNTNRKRVQEDFFLDYEVNLPPLPEQKRLIRKINNAQAKLDIADAELAKQQTLLGQLKQMILQAAIRGELTAGPRKGGTFADAEPAEQLLARIAAEKARLVKAKKLRKEKFLPPLTEEETPFDLPEGWAWCRLIEVIERTESGWSPKCSSNPAPPGKWGVLKTTAVQAASFLQNENKELPTNLRPRPEHEVKAGDVLITRAGPANRVGICAVVSQTRPRLMISDKIIRCHPIFVDGKYLELFISTSQFQGLIEESKQGMAQSQVNISQINLKKTSIPLPPLAEQSAIVARVEALLSLCRSLEAEVAAAADHAATLRRAVLQQAFAPREALARR